MLSGCQEENRLRVDVPATITDIHIERLDREWFEMSAHSFGTQHLAWKDQYGELYARYIQDVLKLGTVDDSNLFEQINRFTTDPSISEVQEKVQEIYPDLSDVEAAFTSAWNYYRYYFPDKVIPQHLSLIGGFNTPAILTEQGIGIGLDMFLGSDCIFYEYLQIPRYLRRRMTPAHVVPTVLKGWIETEFEGFTPTPTLVEEIIHRGRVLYCLDALLPYVADSLKIAYSGEEIQWAHAHEKNVWAHFIDNEMLFTTNAATIAKFTNDGPFTTDLVRESPSRMGHFIGWQIVRAYMERQDSIDLPSLMAIKDAQLILSQSKYNP